MIAHPSAHRGEAVEIRTGGRTLFAPATLEGAVEVKGARPEAVVVAGASELAVPPSAANVAGSKAVGELPLMISVWMAAKHAHSFVCDGVPRLDLPATGEETLLCLHRQGRKMGSGECPKATKVNGSSEGRSSTPRHRAA